VFDRRKLWVPGVETYMPFRTLLVVAVAARSAVRTDEIDGAICAWANERSVEEAMISLQAARLDAGAVRRPADLLGGPHLLARGFWRSVERNYMTYPPTTPGHSRGRTPYPVRHPARTFGESNAHAFQEMLGRDSRA
jgi:crotonobetainyl-CoA:carnitine CoA-transferase CaiB-like acyl-CoA transferase